MKFDIDVVQEPSPHGTWVAGYDLWITTDDNRIFNYYELLPTPGAARILGVAVLAIGDKFTQDFDHGLIGELGKWIEYEQSFEDVGTAESGPRLQSTLVPVK